MNGKLVTHGTVTRHEQCLGGLTFLVAIASMNNSSLLPGASFGQDIDLEAFLAPESTIRDSSNSEYPGWEAAAEGRSSTCTGSTPHAGAVSIMHKLQLTAPESFHIANHHNATLHHHRTENSSSVTYHVSCRKHHFPPGHGVVSQATTNENAPKVILCNHRLSRSRIPPMSCCQRSRLSYNKLNVTKYNTC